MTDTKAKNLSSTIPTQERIARRPKRCPHDMGFDNTLGPLGCRLNALEIECVCLAIAPQERVDRAAVIDRRGIYIASKTKHAARWLEYRAQGEPIISTWIDEAGEGASADLHDLWV